MQRTLSGSQVSRTGASSVSRLCEQGLRHTAQRAPAGKGDWTGGSFSHGSHRACLMDRAVLAARALELLHFLGSRASSASSWAWDLEQIILTCAAPQIPLHNGARSCLLHRARCRPHDAYASCAVPRAWLSVALQTSGRDFQKLMGKWKLKDSLFWYEKLKSV